MNRAVSGEGAGGRALEAGARGAAAVSTAAEENGVRVGGRGCVEPVLGGLCGEPGHVPAHSGHLGR